MNNLVDAHHRIIHAQMSNNRDNLNNFAVSQVNHLDLDMPEFNNLIKIQALVYQAAIHVLKNTDPYLKTGEKSITAKQYRKIEAEFHVLKNKIIQQAHYQSNFFAITANQFMSMISRLRSQERQNEIDLRTPHSFQMTRLFNDYYQLLGCVASYSNWQKGSQVLGPHPSLSDYIIDEIITNDKGLQIVILTPTHNDGISAPVVCCRGTTIDPQNFIDDMNEHIGELSFSKSKQVIEDKLQELAAKHGSVVVTGHSLGGTITQLITEEFCDKKSDADSAIPLIKSAHYFNAPGVGYQRTKRYEEKIQKILEDHPEIAEEIDNYEKQIEESEKELSTLPPEDENRSQLIADILELKNNRLQLIQTVRPLVYDEHHAADLAILTGGQHLPADFSKSVGKFSLKDIFASRTYFLDVHSFKSPLSNKYLFASEFEAKHYISNITTPRRFARYLGEKLRKLISFIVRRSIVDQIENELKMQKLVKQIHEFFMTDIHQQAIIMRQHLTNQRDQAKDEDRRRDTLLNYRSPHSVF